MIENKVTFVRTADILVTEERLNRRPIDYEHVRELAASIRRRGLIHTVLIEKGTNRLIAGNHRLEAYRLNEQQFPLEDWHSIETRYAKDVTEEEMRALELEENVRRRALNWRDEATAIQEFHTLMSQQDPDWTMERTGDRLGLSSGTVSRAAQVARALAEGESALEHASSIRSAHNFLERKQGRALARELDSLVANLPVEGNSISSSPATPVPIEVGDFIQWAQQYGGSKFNHLHCDFPYGIGWDTAKKFNSSPHTKSKTYRDTEETYIALCHALTENWERLVSPSAHVIFWLSAQFAYHVGTRALFEKIKGLKIDPVPLVWHKSDNAGAVPDPERGGRRTYETALFMTYGDRKIVAPVSMSYSAPTERADRIHISQKPESVCRHFMRMTVDENTRLLDPTCGSGTALRAARSLGAASVYGIEIGADLADEARNEFTRSLTTQSIETA